MSDEQQPELRWAPIQPAPRRRGRVWLIVGLSVAALAIVAVLLFFLLPRSDAPAPNPSSPTPTTSSTPSATPTPTQTPSPEPSDTSVATPPPVADPTLDAFRSQVSGWLNDAGRGLDIIANAGGPDALPVVDTLQGDAQRLSDAVPPSSIAGQWHDGVETYSQKLASLRSALSSGSGVAAAVDTARSAAQDLKTLVGL